ncbi:Uncharacterized protein TCM_021044 [Theobroma cacao]|uniref:Uncharacterized protein n=1 Tax=Theobroma cacao TaxID=3641 RepID=A0A061EMK8_THECC|nr:Uncharacterized protein TCM_021044 [Theobroma cacao]
MQLTAAVSLGPRSGASSAEQVAMAKEEIKEMLMELEEEGRLCLGQLPFRKPLIRCFNNRLSLLMIDVDQSIVKCFRNSRQDT